MQADLARINAHYLHDKATPTGLTTEFPKDKTCHGKAYKAKRDGSCVTCEGEVFHLPRPLAATGTSLGAAANMAGTIGTAGKIGVEYSSPCCLSLCCHSVGCYLLDFDCHLDFDWYNIASVLEVC